MTSDPDDPSTQPSDRARFAALLKPSLPARGYRLTPADRADWNRASEQARRAMLKDCGWL